jgi:hypothetical protein
MRGLSLAVVATTITTSLARCLVQNQPFVRK